MTTKTSKLYTQEEFDAARSEAYDRGREEGYEEALDNVYYCESD